MSNNICLDCGEVQYNSENCSRCNSEKVVEKDLLADLAHRLWMHWSQYIAMDEPISDKRESRWESLWVDFDDLPENQKDTDRELVEEMLRGKRSPVNKWE